MGGAVAAAVAATIAFSGTAFASPIDTETYCRPTDPGLDELSGLTSIDGVLYAIGDSGADDRVAVFGADCAVQRWIDVPVDPYDVEDLTSYDGSLWLADIGDNQMSRDTVALTRMDPASGAGELYRLTYPDGAHDAETILIEPGGRPVIVTKELSGVSGVYVPADDQSVADLTSPGPTPMRKVGDLAFTATDTVGGPPFVVGSTLATGGAVSADGTVAAVRTYTDATFSARRTGTSRRHWSIRQRLAPWCRCPISRRARHWSSPTTGHCSSHPRQDSDPPRPRFRPS